MRAVDETFENSIVHPDPTAPDSAAIPYTNDTEEPFASDFLFLNRRPLSGENDSTRTSILPLPSTWPGVAMAC